MKKKLFVTLVLVIFIGLFFSACAPAAAPAEEAPAEEAPAEEAPEEEAPAEKTEYVIGVTQRWGTAPFLRTIAAGAVDGAKEWEEKLGVTITVIVTDAGNEDPAKQVSDMEDLAAQNVDGLLLFPGDSTMVAEPLVNIYNENDIPVVVTDIGVEYGDYVSFIITNNTTAGEMAGARMAEVVPAGGKVIAFNHGPGQLNVQARIAGFTAKATELGLEVLPEKTLDMSAEEGAQLMEDLLVSEPDLAGVFTVGTPPAIGAVSALKAANNTTCKVIAFDPDGETYKLVQEDNPVLEGIVVQDPYYMGFEGMNQLFYFLTGETDKIVKEIDSPITVLTPENADEYSENPQITLN